MVRKVLLFGLPVYLYVLEALLKAMASITSDSLLGPTLAGAGIGFLLPLTELKRVNVGGAAGGHLARINAYVYSARDKTLVDFVWLTFFVSLLAWMYALYLTFRRVHGSWLHSPEFIGVAIFVASVALTEIKERV